MPSPSAAAAPNEAPARARALDLHLGLELLHRLRRHGPAGVLEDLLREIGRETVRVIEREEKLPVGDFSRVVGVGLEVLADLDRAEAERLAEALLFLLHGLGDVPLRLDDLRVRAAEDLDHRRGHLPEEGPLEP